MTSIVKMLALAAAAAAGEEACETPAVGSAMLQAKKSIPREKTSSLTEPDQSLSTLQLSAAEALLDAHAAELRANATRISATLARAATSMPEGPTREMLESLRICGKCNQYKRYGEANDGGYLTCMDGLDKTLNALSIGVEHHDQWSMDTAKDRHVPVAQFDCTVDSSASCEGTCNFFKKCIVSEDNHEQSAMQPQAKLSEAVKLATSKDDVADRTLLLKIDCEGCEWPIFEIAPQQLMSKFAQIIVEFHWFDHTDKHPQYAAALKNMLQNGFKIVHLHGNNCGALYQPSADVVLPTVLEVTMVADAEPLPACLASQQYDQALDRPNAADRPELPMAQLGQ